MENSRDQEERAKKGGMIPVVANPTQKRDSEACAKGGRRDSDLVREEEEKRRRWFSCAKRGEQLGNEEEGDDPTRQLNSARIGSTQLGQW
ncbi:hypothetical protein FCM35_KLT05856 [Carex littledalei]|uniref:Uncharacterized protein n=1 Tax=Carex littledalei TaxID=544730 RepID=A0A833R246_9POAL|nr:hypothetical protein FCM35_KLT05856 [Carex littledalei]